MALGGIGVPSESVGTGLGALASPLMIAIKTSWDIMRPCCVVISTLTVCVVPGSPPPKKTQARPFTMLHHETDRSVGSPCAVVTEAET